MRGEIYVIPSAGGSGLSECDTHFTGSENGVEMLYSETVYNQQAVNIVRFHQTEPGSSCRENVALGIKAPKGVAVDTVGNVFMTQQGARSRNHTVAILRESKKVCNRFEFRHSLRLIFHKILTLINWSDPQEKLI